MSAHVPPVGNEREGLLAFLAQQRRAVRTAAFGLTDSEAAMTPSASALSIGAIVKHLASSERSWMRTVRRAAAADPASYVDGLRFSADESLGAVLADYDAAARDTENCIAEFADLGEPVPVPQGVPWFPQDVEAWSVRWVLLHLIEETARHAGHADVVRESIDGASAIALLAAEERWPPTAWVQPWQRTTEREVAR